MNIRRIEYKYTQDEEDKKKKAPIDTSLVIKIENLEMGMTEGVPTSETLSSSIPPTFSIHTQAPAPASTS